MLAESLPWRSAYSRSDYADRGQVLVWLRHHHYAKWQKIFFIGENGNLADNLFGCKVPLPNRWGGRLSKTNALVKVIYRA